MQRTNLKTTIPNCCLSKFEAETKFEDNQSTNHVIKTQYVQAGKNVTQFVFVSPLSVGLFCSFQLVSTEGNGSVKFDQCSNTLLLIPPLTIRHSSQPRSASSPAVLQLDILVNTAHLGIPKQLQESPLFEQSHQQKRTDDTDHPLICRASKHDADKNLAAYVKWYSLTNYSLFNFALYLLCRFYLLCNVNLL